MDKYIILPEQTVDLRNNYGAKRIIVKTTSPFNANRLFENMPKQKVSFSSFLAQKATKPLGLRNNIDGSFVVIASDLRYANELIKYAQQKNLTVSGDSTAKAGKNLGSIENIEEGHLITFGTSERFDVNWVARRGYAYEKGLVPVYDIVKDWNKIRSAVDELVAEKQEKALARDKKLASGQLPKNPTYRTLKLSDIAKNSVDTEKKASVHGGLTQVFEAMPKTTTVYGKMIGSNFIKVGLTVIPVKKVEIREEAPYRVEFLPEITYKVVVNRF